MSKLKRNVLRFDPECQDRIDEIADLAGRILECDVSRAAVVRAAVQAWLATNESIHPEQLIEAIRRALVKRGRKRNLATDQCSCPAIGSTSSTRRPPVALG